MAHSPLISIVITAYTTERLTDIYELLASIKAQAYPKIEAILVAERSVELFDSVRAYGETAIPNLRVLFNRGETGLSAARNLGISEARGDIIAFIDDDALLLPGWAEATVNAYRDESVIGVTGPALPLWEDGEMAWFPEELYWIVSCTAWCDGDGVREVRNAWGMNMSFRRELFDLGELFQTGFGLHNSQRTRWFDPPPEDVDLSFRAKRRTGKRIIYVPEVRVRHRVYAYRLAPKFIKQRSYSIGYQRRVMRRLYREPDGKGADLLGDEHRLLRRIATRLLPNILVTGLVAPGAACRKLRATATALVYVGLGYYAHLLKPPLGSRKFASRKETCYGTG